MALPANRFALTPQRSGRARNLKGRLTSGQQQALRKQSGHVLVQSGRAVPPPQTKMVAWRTELCMLRKQHRALDAELRQTKVELTRLRAELAGTQAGERTARHQAMHDGLTGQTNRRLFMEELRKAMFQCTNNHSHASVMYLDIDDFKLINDKYGHEVGDGVLRTVGARLAKSVRAGDVVARLGGDEFACLLQGNVSRPQMLALAHKLYESIAAPMKLDKLTLRVQISIGLACAPDDGLTAEGLLDRADAAMYQTKRYKK